MPICPTCGKKFSGFSFGHDPATECRDCRKVQARTQGAAAVDSSIPTPNGSAPTRAPRPSVTIAIVALNVLVYVGMGLSGASWAQPSIRHALQWGANYGPLTLSSQPWRLLTCMFVHFGFVHILFNMWCLFDLGRSLEFLMGRKVFTATYLATGLTASLVSLAWNPWRVSAGASGAIFGVAGAFASYMYVRKVPAIPGTIRQTRRSLAIFIIYNLIRGAASIGIDNSAHVGGLLAGLVFGAIVPPAVRLRKEEFGAAPKVLLATSPIEVRSEEDSGAPRLAWTIIVGSVFVLTIALAGVHARHADVAEFGRAAQSVKSGDTDEAIARLQRIVQGKSKLIFPPLVLGQLFLDLKKPESAIPPLESALALDPHDVEIEHNLALAYLGAGRPADAKREIGKVFEAEKDSQWAVLFIRGVAEGESSDVNSAVTDLRAIVQQYPNWSYANDALAHFEAIQYDDPRPPRLSRSAATENRNLELAAQPSRVTIPYSNLVMESENWPLLP